MPIDEQTRSFLDKASLNPPAPPGSVPLEAFREAVEALRPLGFEREEIREVRDLTIPREDGPDVPARLFLPEGDGAPPLVVWAHGGSWVRVTVDSLDGYFRFVARRSGCALLAVDYRLSPESQFPSAIEEVHAAGLWARDHAAELGCDPAHVAIAGESSGGNLAAAAGLLARERGGPAYAHQLLLLPVLDALFTSDSWDSLGQDYLLTKAQLEWAVEQYAPGADRSSPLLSPVRAESFAGLPPTTVVVGEFDPLRDEGLEYARRLQDAGVPATVIDVPGLIHHALMVPKAIDLGRVAVERVAAALAAALGTDSSTSDNGAAAIPHSGS
jgi:acetyl esterase/lipase